MATQIEDVSYAGSNHTHSKLLIMFSQSGTDVLPQRDEGSIKLKIGFEPGCTDWKSEVVTITPPRHTKYKMLCMNNNTRFR